MKFIQQAYKGNNKWTKYLATFGLIIIAQIILFIPIRIFTGIYYGITKNISFKDLDESGVVDKNLDLILTISTFAIGLYALFFAIKKYHKRERITVITSRKKLDWNRILFAFSIGFILVTLEVLISVFFYKDEFTWNFQPIPFLILVFISFFLLPLQTSYEEIVYRGYLMQGLGTWFKQPWVAWLITSSVFGLLHFANPEVEKLGMGMMPFYIAPGLLWGLITLLDEGTELALGLHAANNVGASIFITSSWDVFQTNALWIYTAEPSLGWTDYLPMLIIYPLIILIFSKKYGWKNWKEKLFGRVYPPIEINEDELIA